MWLQALIAVLASLAIIEETSNILKKILILFKIKKKVIYLQNFPRKIIFFIEVLLMIKYLLMKIMRIKVLFHFTKEIISYTA